MIMTGWPDGSLTRTGAAVPKIFTFYLVQMLFNRREPETFWQRLRVWVWPRRSVSRSLKYMGKRVLRISATPHSVALGLAVGAFCACSPLLGFHIIIAVVLTWFVRGNVAAAVLGTALANPLTIPLIFGLDYAIGHFILDIFGKSAPLPLDQIMEMLHKKSFLDVWEPVFKPTMLGSFMLGGVVAFIIYLVAFWGTSRFQRRRRERLSEKLRLRVNETSL